MSSALTGNQIKDSYQALLKMGTNGSLDPTTLITISDGLGNDTPLQLAGDQLATNYLGNPIGLNLDFSNYLYQFGDFSSVSSGTSFYIDEGNSQMYTKHSGQNEGLFFDFVNSYFQIGDFANTGNNTYINVDDDNKTIQLYTYSGTVVFDYAQIQFNGPKQNGNTGDPNEFLNIVVNGTPYVIKLYTP